MSYVPVKNKTLMLKFYKSNDEIMHSRRNYSLHFMLTAEEELSWKTINAIRNSSKQSPQGNLLTSHYLQ